VSLIQVCLVSHLPGVEEIAVNPSGFEKQSRPFAIGILGSYKPAELCDDHSKSKEMLTK
jgi:hypothetical protein